jgi:glycosyltransferase involved in cell wall biosynthesis
MADESSTQVIDVSDRISGPISGPPTRIAVTCSGDPTDVAAYSGIPAALLKGLTDLGAEGLPLRGDLGPRAQIGFERLMVATGLRPHDLLTPSVLRSRRRALRMRLDMSLAMPAARTSGVRRGVRKLMPLDGVVQYGVGFDVPASLPFVTYEDATLRQVADDYAWPWIGDPQPKLLAKLHDQHRRRYERAKACAFMSHWAARSAVEDYDVDPAKVHVVGAGRNHEPTCLDRDWSVPRALFVGFEWERKNGPAVLRAFGRVRERWPDARLDVVGVHPSLDAEGVCFHGPLSLANGEQRKQVEALFASATFFVMPSIHEPAGIVYAEAQAAGIASVATSSGGAQTIVGDAGIVVDPRDDDAIAAAMLELCDPANAARLGARALARSSLFTWRKVAERLIRALGVTTPTATQLAEFL